MTVTEAQLFNFARAKEW